MDAGSRRRNLGVGVELVDNRPCPGFYLAAVRIKAVVQVYADKPVLFGEREADTIVATLFVSRHRLRIVSPCIGGCAAGPLTCERGVRDLGQLAVTLFRAPTHPLPQVSYVSLLVYEHVNESSRRGEEANALPAVGPA